MSASRRTERKVDESSQWTMNTFTDSTGGVSFSPQPNLTIQFMDKLNSMHKCMEFVKSKTISIEHRVLALEKTVQSIYTKANRNDIETQNSESSLSEEKQRLFNWLKNEVINYLNILHHLF